MIAGSDRRRILVVDDEASVRESLKLLLSRSYDVDIAESGDVAIELLEEAGETLETRVNPDLVIVDVMMPGLDGLGLLERIKGSRPELPVIMLTASKTVKTAVQAMKIGAVDYLSKPFDVDELLELIDETLTTSEGNTRPTNDQLPISSANRSNLPTLPGDFGQLVGKHPVMEELYRKVGQLAERDTTILITGESGTGKELIAREIHARSNRAKGPFIALNCAAIPETLIESELFGHEKGAFTHAVEKRVGHFELANGGTLFLDEIGELSLPVQVKMLRFLQEHEFYRVGRSKPIQVDVRILAATNKNLETAIKDGSFRQDLYYRINVVALEMPALRDRSEDIPQLVAHFVERLSPLYGGRKPAISGEAMALLEKYAWPGNVRELENVTESLLALVTDPTITGQHLPHRIQQGPGKGDSSSDVVNGSLPFEEAERAFETEIILKALQKANFVQTKAAELLGISRRILKYKMDKLGISDTPPERQ